MKPSAPLKAYNHVRVCGYVAIGNLFSVGNV